MVVLVINIHVTYIKNTYRVSDQSLQVNININRCSNNTLLIHVHVHVHIHVHVRTCAYTCTCVHTVRLNKKLTFRCTKRIVLRYAVNRCVTVRHHRCFSVATSLLRCCYVRP